jgi:integrase
MPRPAKGARLWLRPEERFADGRLHTRAVWVIRDGPRKISTGCAAEDRAGAECVLGDHLSSKYQPNRRRGRHPSEILIADVLTIYLTDVAPLHAREDETKRRGLTLDAWWTDKTLADVNGANCRAYVADRVGKPWKSARPWKTGNARIVTAAAARRELEDLRSAINHHRKEGLCSEVVSVVLPARSEARERWLTRSEAARLILAAWRAKQLMPDKESRRAVGQHVARFILVALYTGTRSSAICGAALMPTIGRGHVDLDQGVFYRRAIGRRETSKRQPPVKLPPRLLTHMRRWERLRLSRTTVIEWNGEPVNSVRKGFAAAVRAAGLGPGVTPHILRHTCATWLMQRGVNLWDAAGFLGMTVQQLERAYGHHHPDFQQEAVAALGGQYAERNTVNKSRRIELNVTKTNAFSKPR